MGRPVESLVDGMRFYAVARTETCLRAVVDRTGSCRVRGREFELLDVSSHRLGRIGQAVLALDVFELDGRLEASP